MLEAGKKAPDFELPDQEAIRNDGKRKNVKRRVV